MKRIIFDPSFQSVYATADFEYARLRAEYVPCEKEKAERILKNILHTHEYKAELEFLPPRFIPNYWFTKEPQYGYSSANVFTGTFVQILKFAAIFMRETVRYEVCDVLVWRRRNIRLFCQRFRSMKRMWYNLKLWMRLIWNNWYNRNNL